MKIDLKYLKVALETFRKSNASFSIFVTWDGFHSTVDSAKKKKQPKV